MALQKFEKLGLNSHIIKALEQENFETPTEIQEKTIDLVLQGKDIIARASTGSGKTLAFGSTILQNTKKDYGIQALVLTPTRELAEQNAKALNKFSKHNPSKLNIIPIYGGVSINPQINDLEYAEVVIGTPGRILDHLQRGTIQLKHLKTLVLDEADRMLDMGFIDDVEKIISQCPKQRQTLLFSATISQDIVRLSNKYMNNQIEISAEEYVDPALLTQVYYDIDDSLKFSLLAYLLKNEQANLVMVFCNTRKNVDFVANNLKYLGIEVLPIHGGFSQDKRNRIMESFHSKKAHVLVCTDVAARGLDIKGISHVYNYNIPNDSKEYIHRIGRTARAGKEGKVINLVSSRDYENFANVLKDDSLKIPIEPTPLIERISIRWIPERRRGRDTGRENFRGSRNSRNYSNKRYDRNSKNDKKGRGYRSFSRDEESRNHMSSYSHHSRKPDRRDNRDSRNRTRHSSHSYSNRNRRF